MHILTEYYLSINRRQKIAVVRKKKQIPLVSVIDIEKFNKVGDCLRKHELFCLIQGIFNVYFVEYDAKENSEQLEKNGVIL